MRGKKLVSNCRVACVRRWNSFLQTVLGPSPDPPGIIEPVVGSSPVNIQQTLLQDLAQSSWLYKIFSEDLASLQFLWSGKGFDRAEILCQSLVQRGHWQLWQSVLQRKGGHGDETNGGG